MHLNHLMIIFIIIASFGLLGILLTSLPSSTMSRLIKLLRIHKKVIRTEPKLDNTKLNYVHATKSNVDTLSKSSHVLYKKNQEFLVIYLMAPKGYYYTGYQLWEAFMDAKLTYGEMNIFHAYDSNHHNQILFSVAGAVEPGYFNVHQIESMRVPGLCLFMPKIATPDAFQIFEGMMHAANQLANTLGGSLYDDQQQPLTEDRINDYQSHITGD